MYEARFTTKQIYDNYAKSVSKPKSYTPAKSRSLGAFEPDPAQRNTTTRSTYTPPTRRNTKKNKGSTYDEVPQVLTQSIVQRPKPKPTKETGYQKVTRIFNEAMSGFGDFEVPTQPTFDTVKPQNLYKDNRYFGPQVYTPDTSQFGRGYEKKYFLGMELPTGSPSLPKSLKRSNVNIFGNTKDHPRLNMFGVKRSYTRNPDSLMAPPTMSKPEINFDDRTELLLGTRNAVARALDFVEDSDPQTTIITSQHTVEKGESVLSIVEDFNRDKPDKEKVTLEEVGELNNIPNVVENPFGRVQKGDILQIPVKKETAVQVLRQEIERERKVKKELLEFKRLSGEQKIKILREKGIIPEESIQKISDSGEISPELEAITDELIKKYVQAKEDLEGKTQAGSITTEELKNVATEDMSGFGGMGPDPSTGKKIKGLMSPTPEPVDAITAAKRDITDQFIDDIGTYGETDHGDTPVQSNDEGADENNLDVAYGHKLKQSEKDSGMIHGIKFKNDDGTYIALTEAQKREILKKDFEAETNLARTVEGGWDSKLAAKGSSWNQLDFKYQNALSSLAFNTGGKAAGKQWDAVLDAAIAEDPKAFAREMRRTMVTGTDKNGKPIKEITRGTDNRVAKELYYAGIISSLEEVKDELPKADKDAGIPMK
tara:strand:+ start:66 stop:2030 length:1965 start_codon:yes stop_codon:yes gene_type:complete